MSQQQPDDQIIALPLTQAQPGWDEHWRAVPSGQGSEVFVHRQRPLILKHYTVRKMRHWLCPPYACGQPTRRKEVTAWWEPLLATLADGQG